MTTTEMPVAPRMTFRKAEEVAPTRPEWLWDRWLAVGTIHLLVGRQGQGKSTWAGYVVSQLSAGRPLPGDTAKPPMRCALLSFEEADERQSARLMATKAAMTNIVILGDVEDVDQDGRQFRRPWRMPNDCTVLEDFLMEQDIDVLVVDGLGYVVQGDNHNYSVVGSALSTLGSVAERTGCAVLGIVHPPKGGSDPSTVAIGSTAWTSVTRLVWLLGIDPEDETRRVVRMAKSNYKYPDHGVSFTIADEPTFEVGVVAGLGSSDVSPEVLAAASVPMEERSERENARDILRQLLADGPMAVAALLKMTREAGLSDRTVERARRDLGVKSTQAKDGAGKVTGWVVSLPATTPPTTPPLSQPVGVGGVGGVDTHRENEQCLGNQTAKAAQSPRRGLDGGVGER